MPTACAPMVGRVWSRVSQRGLEARARFADDPVTGDAAVLEVQLCGGRALDAQLLLLRPDREAFVVVVHDERGDSVGALVRVGHRHDGVPGRLGAVGDPALGAVEDPVVAVAPWHGCAWTRRRSRPHARTVRTTPSPHLRQETGSTCCLSSSEPLRIRPIVPSLLTAGMSDDDAHTRATSSITMQVATESAP